MDLKRFRENHVTLETGFGLKLPECPFKECACPIVECCDPHRSEVLSRMNQGSVWTIDEIIKADCIAGRF